MDSFRVLSILFGILITGMLLCRDRLIPPEIASSAASIASSSSSHSYPPASKKKRRKKQKNSGAVQAAEEAVKQLETMQTLEDLQLGLRLQQRRLRMCSDLGWPDSKS